MLVPLYIVTFLSDSLTARFTDTLGDYDVTTNPNGWGAPNEEESAIVTARLRIYKPDTTTYGVGSSYVDIDLLTYGYPLATKTVDIPVAAVSETTFYDGVWKFSLLIEGVDSYDEVVWYGMARNGIICCIDTKHDELTRCGCKHLSEEELTLIRLKNSLYAISKAEDCQDYVNGAEEILYASTICAGVDCKPCRGC